MSEVPSCPHCRGAISKERSDEQGKCPHCGKISLIEPDTIPISPVQESFGPSDPAPQAGVLDFSSDEKGQSDTNRWRRFDGMSADWISVYNGLALCKFAALLLIGSMFLTATCLASPGKGRALPVLIPMLIFLIPLMLDLAGCFNCTAVPDALGRRYARKGLLVRARLYPGVAYGSRRPSGRAFIVCLCTTRRPDP